MMNSLPLSQSFLEPDSERSENGKRIARKPSNSSSTALADFFAVKQDTTIQGSRPASFCEVPEMHTLTIPYIESLLQTDVRQGLSSTEAGVRLLKDGANAFVQTANRPLWHQFLLVLAQNFGVILSLTVILSGVAYGLDEDRYNLLVLVLLCVVVFLQGIFICLQRRRRHETPLGEKGFSPARDLSAQQCTVIRNGAEREVPVSKLVRGDIVCLTSGQCVPADVRIISTAGFKVDKSALTGVKSPVVATVHSTDKSYSETRNICFMGTLVLEGKALAIVLETGSNTQMGRILASTGAAVAPSKLEEEFKRYDARIATIGILLGSLVALAGSFWLLKSHPDFLTQNELILHVVGIMVAIVPITLNGAVTFVLSTEACYLYNTHNVSVSNLGAVEALGAVNVICSDMTGTITMNQMRVVRVTAGLSEVISTPFTQDSMRTLDPLVQCAVLCNEGRLNGSAEDIALMDFAKERGTDILLENCVVGITMFSSVTKLATSVARNVTTGHYTVYCRGSPEILLSRCESFLDAGGSSQPLTLAMRDTVLRRQARLGDMAMRVIAFSKFELPETYTPPTHEIDFETLDFPLDMMIFMGLVAVQDPPRAQVEETIRACQEAGVRVMMVTSDHSSTAVAIARQVGIFHDPTAGTASGRHGSSLIPNGPKAMKEEDCTTPRGGHSILIQRAALVTGHDIDTLDPARLRQCLQHSEIVFARASPEHKLKIIQALREMGNCVAVTGDGLDDAPALKAADVGLAMEDGADAAKAASCMVLKSSHFSSIYDAIRAGRRTYDNLQKTLVFLLPCLLVLVSTSLSTIFGGTPPPLSVFLILCVKVVTNVPGVAALGVQEEDEDVMKRQPRDPVTEGIVQWRIFLHSYLFVGILESISCYVVWYNFLSDHGHTVQVFAFSKWNFGSMPKDDLYSAQSVFFTTLVMCQCGYLLSVASKTKPLVLSCLKSSKRYGSFPFVVCGAALLSAALAISITEIPTMQQYLNTRSVSVKYWWQGALAGVAIFAFCELKKCWTYLYPEGCLAQLGW